MEKFIIKIETFFLNVEKFFKSFTFIPRFIAACGAGITAFNDNLFAADKKRQVEIASRNKEAVNQALSETIKTETSEL